MAEFVSGRELSGDFYRTLVGPLLRRHAPDLRHGAALLGRGSEVLGFDDPVSCDHDWGPRVEIFSCSEEPVPRAELDAILERELPEVFCGVPIRFPRTKRPAEGSRHGISFTSRDRFLRDYLGLESLRDMDWADWLSLPQQKLRAIADGLVHHDDPGLGLRDLQESLAWYPEPVWRIVLAAAWRRVGQEEHLVGRAGSVGDELGARLIAGRLVRDLMRLCFYMERRYPPYAKWFGSAFRQLRCAEQALPLFEEALAVQGWKRRDRALAEAYRFVGTLHNETGLTDPINPEPRAFHERRFLVSDGERYARALLGYSARDSAGDLARHYERAPFGSIDLLSDSTDVLDRTSLRARIAELLR